MVDLSDLSNKDLIKEIKSNPEMPYVDEFISRIETGDVATEDSLLILLIYELYLNARQFYIGGE